MEHVRDKISIEASCCHLITQLFHKFIPWSIEIPLENLRGDTNRHRDNNMLVLQLVDTSCRSYSFHFSPSISAHRLLFGFSKCSLGQEETHQHLHPSSEQLVSRQIQAVGSNQKMNSNRIVPEMFTAYRKHLPWTWLLF